MKIYVASSWRCERQPAVVEALRKAGHDVYDFKNPAPGDQGFHWKECANPDVDWKQWSPSEFRKALKHPVAIRGFDKDMAALDGADACVLVLPCGKSAHLELGYAAAAGKISFVLSEGQHEPELMYRMCTAPYVLLSIEETIDALARSVPQTSVEMTVRKMMAFGASIQPDQYRSMMGLLSPGQQLLFTDVMKDLKARDHAFTIVEDHGSDVVAECACGETFMSDVTLDENLRHDGSGGFMPACPNDPRCIDPTRLRMQPKKTVK